MSEPFSHLILTNALVPGGTTHIYAVKAEGWSIRYMKPTTIRYSMSGEEDRCTRIRTVNYKKPIEWKYIFFCNKAQLDNLKADFLVQPPLDKFGMTDVDGETYEVYLDEMSPPKNIYSNITSSQSYFEVQVTIRRNA